MKKITFLLVALACSASFVSAQTVIKGSDTILPLNEKWCALYAKQGGTAPVPRGGGSATGFVALEENSAKIAAASRRITEAEKAAIRNKRGAEPVEIPIALDAVAIYVHPANAVKSLSLAQLKGIFSGQIRDWKEVGGSGGTIHLYGRDINSGTRAFVTEEILKESKFPASVKESSTNVQLLTALSGDPDGIAYGSLEFSKFKVRAIPISEKEGGPAVGPSPATIRNKSYPLNRTLFYYTVGEPSGDVKKFIEFVHSAAGQAAAESVGFVRLK